MVLDRTCLWWDSRPVYSSPHLPLDENVQMALDYSSDKTVADAVKRGINDKTIRIKRYRF